MTATRSGRSRYVAESRALIAEYAARLRLLLAREYPEDYATISAPTTGSARSRYVAETKSLIRARDRRRLALACEGNQTTPKEWLP